MRVEVCLSSTLTPRADRVGEVLEGGSARQALAQAVQPDDKETGHFVLSCVLAWSSMRNTWAETMIPVRRSNVEAQ